MTCSIEIYYKIEITISLQQLESSCMKQDNIFYKILWVLLDIFIRDKNFLAFGETKLCIFGIFMCKHLY